MKVTGIRDQQAKVIGIVEKMRDSQKPNKETIQGQGFHFSPPRRLDLDRKTPLEVPLQSKQTKPHYARPLGNSVPLLRSNWDRNVCAGLG
jgi:hypothetical protein